MKIKIFLLFICVTLISVTNYAQEFVVGAKFGIGNSRYKKQSDGFKTEKYLTQKYALSLEFAPYFSKFFIVSGLYFENNSLGTNLMVPLGLRLAIGKKFKGFIEGAGYYSKNLKTNSEDYILINGGGIKLGAGIQYKFDNNLLIELGYSGRFGFSPHMQKEIILPGYQITYEKYTLSSHQIELCLKYRF